MSKKEDRPLAGAVAKYSARVAGKVPAIIHSRNLVDRSLDNAAVFSIGVGRRSIGIITKSRLDLGGRGAVAQAHNTRFKCGQGVPFGGVKIAVTTLYRPGVAITLKAYWRSALRHLRGYGGRA